MEKDDKPRDIQERALFFTEDKVLTHNAYVLIALAITVLGFALRLRNLGLESLWYDELLQLDIAQEPLALIPGRLRAHMGVPLDYLVSHIWIVLGRSDAWVRIPAVIWGTLTLPIAYQLGGRLLGPGAGLLFMTLLTLSPFHIRYSQEVRPYALVVLGVTLASYALWQLRKTGQWRYLILLQIGVLIFLLAHIFTLPIFFVLVLTITIDFVFNQNRGRVIKSFVGLIVTGLVALAILLVLGWGDILFYTFTEFGEAMVVQEKFKLHAELKPNRGTGPEVNWNFIRNEILTPLGVDGQATSIVLFNGLAGVGLIYLLLQKKYKLTFLLSVWLVLPPVIIVTFLVFRGTFFASRYIISVLPAYLLLVTVGLLALPGWLKRIGGNWLRVATFIILSGLIFLNIARRLDQYYYQKDKENWHLVGDFIAHNAGPNDAIIAFRAEPTINWYYPSAWAPSNYYFDLEDIKAAIVPAGRSWVILSLFSSGADPNVKAWLSANEQNAVRFVLDPMIHVYYLGYNVPREQLLAEIRNFALPADHSLYVSLARENRRNPAVARQYYRLAIEHAPDDHIRAEYQSALNALP